MESNFQQQYLTLVQDTRLFIQAKLHPVRLNPPGKAFSPAALPAEPIQKPESKTGKDMWELQPMAQVEESPFLRKKLSSFVQICDPIVSTLLILPEENPTHRLFLENVSRAITRAFSPASVVLYNEAVLHNCQGKILLVPAPLLKKKYPHAQPHHPFKTENFSMIPLENLDLYAHDVNCKLALWNTIQRLFQS
jgi:hypothetical protein